VEPADSRTPQPENPIRETAVARVMTSTSISKHPTAFHATGLPILQAALNVQVMSPTLAPLLGEENTGWDWAGQHPEIAYAKLLAYKQGNRGLIQYEVAGVQNGDRLLLLGKLFPSLEQATRVYEIMRVLWAEVFAGASGFGVPRPLGYVSDLLMLVYIRAEGDLLNEVILEKGAPRYMRLAGAWLAALHGSKLALERRLQIATELTNLQAWGVLIGHKWPDQAEPAHRLSARLRESADNLQFRDDVPIHKDFHYGHIVVNDGLNIIDFDEVRYGDRNFDVAHFCANLYLLAYRKEMQASLLSSLQNAFLDTYAAEAGWRTGRRFKFFYGYTCLKIAKQLCTIRGLRPRPEGEEQRLQVSRMLEQGLRVLEDGL
jgi:aminoglycoside phosphotransferase (APT) family kinase protein